MYLDEFLTELYSDELSDLFVGNRHIPNDSRPKLLPLLNAAMAYAYSKWKCKYDSELLATQEDTNEYTLAAADDVLQIIQIVNVYGLDVPTTEWQALGATLYFPTPANETLEVIYKPKPVKFTVAQDDTITLLELPEMLIPWLKAYVAHRYFASMHTESAVAAATKWWQIAQMHENTYMNTNTSGEYTAPTNRKMAFRGFA